MNKFLTISLLTLSSIFSSCERDPGLDPLPTIVGGQFVRLDISNKLLDFGNISNTTFGGVLTTPSGNVAKYDLFVRYTNANGIISDNYVLIKSITSFPTDLTITSADLSLALNIPISQFRNKDRFRFLGYSYDKSGNKADYNSLSTTVKIQPGMKQGYKFITGYESGPNLTGFFDNYGL